MKNELNPIVAAVIVIVLLGGVGYFLYSRTGGRTFTKDEANAGMNSGRMEINFDASKAKAASPGGN